MKWTIRKGKFPPNSDAEERKSFEEVDLKGKDGSPELKKELEDLGFTEWVVYPGPLNNFDPIKIKGASRKYEIFCGGFLYYHDVQFKKYPEGVGYTVDANGNPSWKTYPNKSFEHKIFFEWFKDKGLDHLRVYINVTPDEFNANPPPPPPPPPPESL